MPYLLNYKNIFLICYISEPIFNISYSLAFEIIYLPYYMEQFSQILHLHSSLVILLNMLVFYLLFAGWFVSSGSNYLQVV
jgi:hypothetical protein